VTKTSYLIPTQYLQHSNANRVRLTVSDGFNEVEVQSEPFSTSGHPPSVSITNLPQDPRILSGTLLLASGQAVADDGTFLAAEELHWSMDQKPTNAGFNFSQVLKQPGIHRLTLSAKDSYGRVSSITKAVTAIPNKPFLTSFKVSDDVSPGIRNIGITASSSSSATMEVLGRRFKVTSTPRNYLLPITASGATTLPLIVYSSGGVTKL
jgi:hypothetical protein